MSINGFGSSERCLRVEGSCSSAVRSSIAADHNMYTHLRSAHTIRRQKVCIGTTDDACQLNARTTKMFVGRLFRSGNASGRKARPGDQLNTQYLHSSLGVFA